MRCLRGTVFPSVDLHHLWYIQRIDSSKGVGGDQDNTTVGIYLLLGIAKFNSLQDFKAVSWEAALNKSRSETNQRVRSSERDLSDLRLLQASQGSSTEVAWGCCRPAVRIAWSRQFLSDHSGIVSRHISRGKKTRCASSPQILLTSPFSTSNTSCTFSPSTSFSFTSDANHPSVGSGCQALVPTS